VRIICEVLDYARSSYYRRRLRPDEQALSHALQVLALEHPTYGYRRLTVEIRKRLGRINSKRVRRLMRQLGLNRKRKHKKRYTTQSQHTYPRYPNLVRDLPIIRPNQVWVADLTWVHLRSEDVYLAVVMDVFTRCIRGWHLSRSLDETLTTMALERALEKNVPELHHSDQGVQYAATGYVKRLRDLKVQISMAEIGQAWQNGHAERLIRTIKEEEVYLSEYCDFHDAYQQIGRFLDDVYMHKRIHSALGYLTPVAFEREWFAHHSKVIGVIQ
jgi:transposase InsO family protein